MLYMYMCNSDKRHNSTVCHALLVSLKLALQELHSGVSSFSLCPLHSNRCCSLMLSATPLLVPRGEGLMLKDCFFFFKIGVFNFSSKSDVSISNDRTADTVLPIIILVLKACTTTKDRGGVGGVCILHSYENRSFPGSNYFSC